MREFWDLLQLADNLDAQGEYAHADQLTRIALDSADFEKQMALEKAYKENSDSIQSFMQYLKQAGVNMSGITGHDSLLQRIQERLNSDAPNHHKAQLRHYLNKGLEGPSTLLNTIMDEYGPNNRF